MFQAARHTLRRAATRAAFANAPAFPRAALTAGECAVASRSAPSAVAAVRASLCVRGLHASSPAREEEPPSAPSGERGLSQVLGEELEHERTTYVPSEVVVKGPPEPFEIIETDGDCEITLVRAYGDDEEIAVTFNATEGLEFSCATDGETVEVRNVRYESLGSFGSSDEQDDEDAYFSSYPGPNYDELDESVQEEFHKYLEARGIDATLANYIAEAHVDKEQREYTRWLENVANFVK